MFIERLKRVQLPFAIASGATDTDKTRSPSATTALRFILAAAETDLAHEELD
jgi:hypothetical protein